MDTNIVGHTPGPWRTLGNDVVDERGRHIASAQYNPAGRQGSTEQMSYNARLIAAAPELLHMLKLWVEAEQDMHFAEQAHDPQGCRYCESVALIAKAEGRD